MPRLYVITCLLLSLVGVLGGGRACARALDRSCQRTLVTRLPLRNDGGYLSIPVTVNGQLLSMIVDTGSEGGMVTSEAAEALRLHEDKTRRTVISGTDGGRVFTANALIGDFRLGGYSLGSLSMPVGHLPGMPVIRPPVAGLVGADILSRFDIDMNVPGGFMALYEVRYRSIMCSFAPPDYRAAEAVALKIRGNRPYLTVKVDGQEVDALLDSGARSRILSMKTAARLGVTLDKLALDPGGETSGVDLVRNIYRWHRFKSFGVGSQTELSPVLTVMSLAVGEEMLLGSDWLARHRVWISYSGKKLFIEAGAPPGRKGARKHP